MASYCFSSEKNDETMICKSLYIKFRFQRWQQCLAHAKETQHRRRVIVAECFVRACVAAYYVIIKYDCEIDKSSGIQFYIAIILYEVDEVEEY